MAGERFYTVTEANAALDRLRPVLERIRTARRQVLSGARRVKRVAATDGGDPAHRQAVTALRSELEGLAAEGIVLRDGETGLVDFPARREGRTVYLCWRLDEPAVAHWHEVDAGFGARRPLP